MRSFLKIGHLGSFLTNTSIRNRIWLGFGLILSILLFVSLSTLSRFINLSDGISHVTEDIQPVVLIAQNLETEIEASSRMLGFYLLTKETSYRESYSAYLDAAVDLMNQLAGLSFVIENEEYRIIVYKIQQDLQQLAAYKDRMIELAKDTMKNIPAQRLAVEKLNPAVQQLQSMISQMIISDYEEDNADGSRDELRQAIYDLRYYNVQIASELRTFLAFRSEVNVQNIKIIMQVVQDKLKIIQNNKQLYTFEQDNLMKEFISINETYYKDLDEAASIHSTDRYRTDIFLVKTEIGPLSSKIESNLGRLVESLKEVITDTSNELQDEASDASNKVIMGMTIGILFGMIIAFLMSRMITLPINEAVDAMEDIAEGEGDLTHRLNAKGTSEIAMMAQGFNHFTSKVQLLVSQVAKSVEKLSAVVDDVATIASQTQKDSLRQSQQTEQVATAVTEMSATIHEVAENANLAADSAKQADENAKLGQKIVVETVSSINSLAAEIETGADVINKLSKDAESIGSVLDVIKGIAEQTNLLALNAAIEAARAGEQGRGFAVVADEVRTLASRTRESTTEIESMIENLQVQAQAAVEVISQGQVKGHASVENASNAGKALNEITSSVAIITDMNIQIAVASEQQSAVSEEINQHVVNINNVANDNVGASNRLSVSSDELAALADELQQLVSQFKY
jgi:methyl-accepting chemotaxis protein